MVYLYILVKIIILFLLLILALIFASLILPMGYFASVHWKEKLFARFYVSWPWYALRIVGEYKESKLLLGIYIGYKRIYAIKKEEKNKVEEKEKDTKKPKKEKKVRPKPDIKEFIDKKFISIALNYIKRVVRIVKPKRTKIYGSFGFDDPSYTGMTFGFISALKGIFPKANINLKPLYNEEVLDITIQAIGKVQIARILILTLATMLKKPIRTIIFRKR